MAVRTIKATFALDVETKTALDWLAAKWDVSKSEAVRRAIRQAAGTLLVTNRLAALDTLQRRSRMTVAKSARWVAATRRARQNTNRPG